MSFKLALSHTVEKLLDKVDRPTKERLWNRLRQIQFDPMDAQTSKTLAYPKGYRSARVGDWRIIFTVAPEEQLIQVISIDQRGQVYRTL